jgi:hypothetical protein
LLSIKKAYLDDSIKAFTDSFLPISMNEHFASRMDAARWNELMNDIGKIVTGINEARATDTSAGSMTRLFRNLKSKMSNGVSVGKHAKSLPGKILSKWIEVLDEINISIFLFYQPEFNSRGDIAKNVNLYGFVLQMHFGLGDFRGFRSTDVRMTDLETDLLAFKSSFKKTASRSATPIGVARAEAPKSDKGDIDQRVHATTPVTPVAAFGDCVCF